MPVVVERKDMPTYSARLRRNNQVFYLSRQRGTSKAQTGYRSGYLYPIEKESLRTGGNTWGTAVADIANDRTSYEYVGKKARAFMVNDRDYTQIDKSPAPLSYKTNWITSTGAAYVSDVDGMLTLDMHNYSSSDAEWPADGAARSIAGELLRQSVPTQPSFDLTRFVGEMIEWKSMFNIGNYLVKSTKQIGKTHLNATFGIAPTAADILALCHSVLQMDELVREFIAHEGRALRRSRSRVLSEDTTKGRIETTAGGVSQIVGSPLGTSFLGDYVCPSSLSGTGIVAVLDWSVARVTRISSFATFEYFIPKPQGLVTRMQRAKRMASQVIGEGLTLPVIYDLTPFSWLLDWFVDIGGLLHYQQAVASNSIVMSRSGYSLFETVTVRANHAGFYQKNSGPGYWSIPGGSDITGSGTSSVSRFRHRRRKGSPYSMQPTWTGLSKQQWAVLGALGLAFGPDGRFLR